MRGRVAVLVLLLPLLSVPSFPQCSFAPAYSFPYRTSFLDVAVDGNDLWGATSYGLQLFDRTTDPPKLVASIPAPGATRVVRLSGGTAYAGSGEAIHVVRRNGTSLQITRSVETGGTVNDIIATPLNLYVATSNGLHQYNLLDFSRTTLPTSSPAVSSIALSGATLYAADGDSSVEMFNVSIPSIPQRTGEIAALPRSLGVRIAGNRLYVSDGIQADIFLATTAPPVKLERIAAGMTSLAQLAGDVVFAAGSDRRLRAFDLTNAGAPVELYSTELVPAGGTINRISALQIGGTRLYAAAGDAGLLSFDIGAFAAPFPARSYSTGATTSVYSLDGKIYVSRATTGVSEFNIGQSGQLTAARQWDARPHVIHDGANRFLLTSSGATLLYWTIASSPPALVSTATFAAPIASAIVVGSRAYAVLDNRTLWSADLAQATATPQAIAVSGFGKPSFFARSGNAAAIAQLEDDGTTTIGYFATGDLAATPEVRSVAGLASTGVVLSGGRAAVSTFVGVTLIDFPARTREVLPQPAVSRLAFSGNNLLVLDGRTLTVWNAATSKKVRDVALPVEGSDIHTNDDTTNATSVAGIATSDGVMSVKIDAASQQPLPIAWRGGNAYYRKLVATPSRVYLFDGRNVDIFETTHGAAPRHTGALRAAGTIDIAASHDRLFALSSSGIVTVHGRDGGAALAQASIQEGSDTLPLALHVVRGAPWVSLARGCLTGACEKKTLVLDPQSLVRTATINGATLSAAVSGTRAWTITDLPGEIRSLDVTDPLRPAQLASRSVEGNAVSIAQSAGTVYALGDKLYAYSDSTLARTGEFLASMTADPSQRVAMDGTCGAISGRSFAPQLFAVPQWTQTSTPPSPAQGRDLAIVDGRLYVLTDYSLEIWSRTPAAPAGRRRAID